MTFYACPFSTMVYLNLIVFFIMLYFVCKHFEPRRDDCNTKKQCSVQYRKKCDNVPHKKCRNVEDQKCHKEPERVCHNVEVVTTFVHLLGY